MAAQGGEQSSVDEKDIAAARKKRYNRSIKRAQLYFEAPGLTRIPVHLLGSGIQQIVTLLGRLLTSGAPIVAIEEPELNLRYTLQLRLREALTQLAAGSPGIEQLFLTSHSPAFEVGSQFYAMLAGDDGPRVEQRPVDDAPLFTEHVATTPREGAPLPLSYLSREGLVVVPQRAVTFPSARA